MASVTVDSQLATGRALPLVSVRSGQPADGYAPAGRPELGVVVPLTQQEFDQVRRLDRHRRSALWGGVACLVVGLALTRFRVVLPLGLVIAVLSAALWSLASFQKWRLLPRVLGRGDGRIELSRVHPDFVRALGE